MKIIYSYLLKSIAKSSLYVLLILILIFNFFNLLNELDDIGKGTYQFATALNYLFLLTPSLVNSLVILALMIGTVIALGSLNSNRELIILQSATLSLKKVIFIPVIFIFLISFILISLTELIAPISKGMAIDIKNISLNKDPVKLSDKVWIKKDKKFILITRNPESDFVENVKLFDLSKSPNTITFAQSNNLLEMKDSLLMENINSKEVVFKNNISSIFQSNTGPDKIITIPFQNTVLTMLKNNPANMSFNELIASILFSLEGDMDSTIYRTELIYRLIKPFTLIGMVLVALPFVINFSRTSSISNRIFISIVVGLSTHLMIKISSIASLKFESLGYLGPFLPTLVLVVIGLYLTQSKLKSR